jgi:hypothetical protein
MALSCTFLVEESGSESLSITRINQLSFNVKVLLVF